jgi:hypothetical protein
MSSGKAVSTPAVLFVQNLCDSNSAHWEFILTQVVANFTNLLQTLQTCINDSLLEDQKKEQLTGFLSRVKIPESGVKRLAFDAAMNPRTMFTLFAMMSPYLTLFDSKDFESAFLLIQAIHSKSSEITKFITILQKYHDAMKVQETVEGFLKLQGTRDELTANLQGLRDFAQNLNSQSEVADDVVTSTAPDCSTQ